jgi:tRNA(adenine34) deaminase
MQTVSALITAEQERALFDEAQAAHAAGEVPIGALLVMDGEIVGRGHNRCVSTNDPTAHAEIVALRDAAQRRGNYRLVDSTLIVSLEPCVMCAGAILNARVARVIYASKDPKAGAAGSVLDLFAIKPLNHHAEVVQDERLAPRATQLLQRFFQEKRARPKVPAFAIEIVEWAQEHEALSKVRFAVFVHEQKIPAESEIDALDPQSLHALARLKDGTAIATGRLLPNGHIGRMAVLKAYRGTGAGMAILQRLVQLAKERGFSETALSAQTQASAFYARAGFVAYGDEYLDEGIPHRMMKRTV